MDNPRLKRAAVDAAGGPAFPDRTEYGLTVRDYFAAAALTGLLAFPSPTGAAQYPAAAAARHAYAMADAMLQARLPKPDPLPPGPCITDDEAA